MINATDYIPYYLKSYQKTGIVIPCYKESVRFNKDEYLKTASKLPPNTHIFLADDGSPDDTFVKINELHKSNPDRFSAIQFKDRQGKGETVRRVMKNLAKDKFDNVGFLDADLAVKFSEVHSFLKAFADNPEANTVIGVRPRLAGHKVDRSLPKYILQRSIGLLGGLLFSPMVTDTQCGAKFFKAQEIKPALEDKFVAKRWLFDQELLTRISRLPQSKGKQWLVEHPVSSWTEIGNSHINIRDYFHCLTDDYISLLKDYRLKEIAQKTLKCITKH